MTDPTFKVAISRFALDRKIPPGAVGLGSVFLLAQRFGWSKER